MKKNYILLFTVILTISLSGTFAQVGINTDGSDPDASAMLDVKSTDKGFLPPRMTISERNSISSPAEGLMIYNTDRSRMEYFNGTVWRGFVLQRSDQVDCGNDFIDSRDGKIYVTVQIGSQCWMAENLNVGTRIDGIDVMSDDGEIEKYCYDDYEDNCDEYGALYLWNELMQYVTTEGIQGICPAGWHIPTDDEWKTLEMHLGMSQSEADQTGWRGTDEGKKLKSTSGWYNNGNGNNSSGFMALPGGYRGYDGSFTWLEATTTFYTSTEYNEGYAWQRYLTYGYDLVSRIHTYGIGGGFSVRCLKD